MEVWKIAKELFDKNEFDKSLELIDQILTKEPFHTDGLYHRALIYRKKELYNRSLNDFDQLVNLLPNKAEVYCDRGITKFYLKDKAGSIDDLNKAQELEPNNPYRYSSRAYIKGAFKDTEGAIADYIKTLELNPNDAISYNNLGLLEEQLGRMKSAKSRFKTADRLNGIKSPAETDAPIQKKSDKKPSPKKEEVKPSLFQEFVNTLKLLLSNKDERKAFIEFIKNGGKKK